MPEKNTSDFMQKYLIQVFDIFSRGTSTAGLIPQSQQECPIGVIIKVTFHIRNFALRFPPLEN